MCVKKFFVFYRQFIKVFCNKNKEFSVDYLVICKKAIFSNSFELYFIRVLVKNKMELYSKIKK